jgi:hypothetical protein
MQDGEWKPDKRTRQKMQAGARREPSGRKRPSEARPEEPPAKKRKKEEKDIDAELDDWQEKADTLVVDKKPGGLSRDVIRGNRRNTASIAQMTRRPDYKTCWKYVLLHGHGALRDGSGDKWVPNKIMSSTNHMEELDSESWLELLFTVVDNAISGGVGASAIEKMCDLFKVIWALKCTGLASNVEYERTAWKMPAWIKKATAHCLKHPLYLMAKKKGRIECVAINQVIFGKMAVVERKDVRHVKTGEILTEDQFITAKEAWATACLDGKRTGVMQETFNKRPSDWKESEEIDADRGDQVPRMTLRTQVHEYKQKRTSAAHRRTEHSERACCCVGKCVGDTWRAAGKHESAWKSKMSSCPVTFTQRSIQKAELSSRQLITKLNQGSFEVSSPAQVKSDSVRTLVHSMLVACGMPKAEAIKVRWWMLRKTVVSLCHRCLKTSFDEISLWSYHKIGGVTQKHYDMGTVSTYDRWGNVGRLIRHCTGAEVYVPPHVFQRLIAERMAQVEKDVGEMKSDMAVMKTNVGKILKLLE